MAQMPKAAQNCQTSVFIIFAKICSKVIQKWIILVAAVLKDEILISQMYSLLNVKTLTIVFRCSQLSTKNSF